MTEDMMPKQVFSPQNKESVPSTTPAAPSSAELARMRTQRTMKLDANHDGKLSSDEQLKFLVDALKKANADFPIANDLTLEMKLGMVGLDVPGLAKATKDLGSLTPEKLQALMQERFGPYFLPNGVEQLSAEQVDSIKPLLDKLAHPKHLKVQGMNDIPMSLPSTSSRTK